MGQSKSDRNAAIRKLRDGGMTFEEIALVMKIDRKTVSRIYYKGTAFEKREAARKDRNRAIVAAHLAGGETASSLGRRFGLSSSHIVEVLHRAGATVPRRSPAPPVMGKGFVERKIRVDAEEADGGLDRLAEMANAAPVARKDAPCFATPDPGRWSDETLAALDRDWHAGLPTAEIGQRLGFTKNAIVGKAHRRHLPGRLDPIVRNAAPKPPKPVRPAWPPTPLNPQPAGFVTLPPLPSIAAIPRPAPPVASLTPSTVPPRATTPPAPLPAPRQLATPYVARPRVAAPARPAAPPMTPPAPARHIAAPAEVETLDWRAEGWPEPNSPETLGGVVAAQGIAEHPLAGRDARCCQWPLGEPGRPGFRYCDAPQTTVRRLGPLGLPVFVASPYCEAHRAASVTRYVAPGRAVAGSAEGDRAAV